MPRSMEKTLCLDYDADASRITIVIIGEVELQARQLAYDGRGLMAFGCPVTVPTYDSQGLTRGELDELQGGLSSRKISLRCCSAIPRSTYTSDFSCETYDGPGCSTEFKQRLKPGSHSLCGCCLETNRRSSLVVLSATYTFCHS